MPRKRSPIFQKVSNLLKISILLAKMRKPNIPKLIFLKKSRKLKKFKLVQHHSHRYIQEYQFSPSSSPLIHYHRKPFKKRNYREMYALFLKCQCFGGMRANKEWGHRDHPLMEALPSIEDAGVTREMRELSDSGGEEDSVDERAERFIERFYQEMRMQRQKSRLQLMGC